MDMNVPETVRAELREYLRELGAARSRLEKSKAKRDAKKKKKKQATPDPVNQNTNINMNEMNAQSYPIKNSDSPALVTTFKRPRPTSAESTNSTRFFAALTPKKKLSPHDEYQQLKEDIAYKVQRMNEIRNIADIQQGLPSNLHEVFQINHKGRAGHVTVTRDGFVSHEELLASLYKVNEDIDMPKYEAICDSRSMRVVKFGASTFHIPVVVSVSLIHTTPI
jgi:hypothetical protein